MYKEIFIIIVVIALVICLDVITNNYTKVSVEMLTSQLKKLREDIVQENFESSKNKMEEIWNTWRERYNILAYYIEHDELEKVETELTRLNADMKMKEYKHCINELETTIFILNHIKQKEELDIKSIF